MIIPASFIFFKAAIATLLLRARPTIHGADATNETYLLPDQRFYLAGNPPQLRAQMIRACPPGGVCHPIRTFSHVVFFGKMFGDIVDETGRV